MSDNDSKQDRLGKALTRVSLTVSIIVGLFTIISYLSGHPGIGLFLLILALISIEFFGLILLRRKNIYAACVITVVLTIAAFFLGILFRKQVTSIWAIPEISSSDEGVLPIEMASSISSSLYQGASEGGQGAGYLTVTSVAENGKSYMSYKLDYDLPNEKGAFVGFTLKTSDVLDLSRYNFLRMRIRFGDEQSRCSVLIKDSFGGNASVILGEGGIVSAKREEQSIEIPLKTHFDPIAWKSIKEVLFDVNPSFIQGKHSFTVSKIEFRQ